MKCFGLGEHKGDIQSSILIAKQASLVDMFNIQLVLSSGCWMWDTSIQFALNATVHLRTNYFDGLKLFLTVLLT